MNPSPPRTPSALRPHTLLSSCVAIAMGALGLLLVITDRPAAAAGTPTPDASTSAAAVATVAADPASTRQERDAIAVRAAPARTFEDFLAELVALGLQTRTALETDGEPAARRLDDQGRQLLDAMLREVVDVHAHALQRYVGLPHPVADDDDGLRERICLLVVDHGLRSGLTTAGAGDRQQLDSLVLGMLTALPHSEAVARGLGQQLVDRPYLGLTHETAVLELVELAGQRRFDHELASRLLLTLWHNLGASGGRTADATARLALLWMNDANIAQRLAALEMLLADDRYRDMALDIARRSNDRQLQRGLALAAAARLEPAVALQILEQLGLPAADLMSPYLTLGRRAPQVLRQLYDRRLADDIEPEQRAELVRASGFSRDVEGLQLALFALDHDPSRVVRRAAMFAVTGEAAETHGERAISAMLDDPEFHTPENLGAAVGALLNLKYAGLTNAVDRLGQRLRATSGLLPADRQQLEQILADGLPGGQTSR